MMKSLKLSGVKFDPDQRVIYVETPMRIEVLNDLVIEAFKTRPMLAYNFPLEVLETQDTVYYVYTWNVVGPVEIEKLDGKQQILVHI